VPYSAFSSSAHSALRPLSAPQASGRAPWDFRRGAATIRGIVAAGVDFGLTQTTFALGAVTAGQRREDLLAQSFLHGAAR